MSDKTKTTIKPKRPSTVCAAASFRARATPAPSRFPTKTKPTPTEADVTISRADMTEMNIDVDADQRQAAYGKFLRALLEDCMVEEKVKREETQMDIQMAQLADRFQKTINQLDKTNQRLKDIRFPVEQQRLLDLKSEDLTKFIDKTESSNMETILNNIYLTEQSHLDCLETKNVGFGYSKESGHKQLLDAVDEALNGFEQIRKHSKLDLEKFKEYEKSLSNITELQKEKFDFESRKKEFAEEFPDVSEKLLQEMSEKMAKMIMTDEEEPE